MSTNIQSKGVDLDSIFDPYITGTSPGLTGIQSAGTDIHTRYAPLVYGTAAPATGIACKVGGAGSFVDLNTLFAAKGTANYSLPINGQTYSGSGTAASGNVSAHIILNINNAQYEFVGSGTGSPGNTWLYNIPSGVSQYTYKVDSGVMQPWTNIPSSGTFALVFAVNASSNNQGTITNTHTVTLYFGNGGTIIYSGTCTMTATADSGA